jgi:hypothetical protein
MSECRGTAVKLSTRLGLESHGYHLSTYDALQSSPATYNAQVVGNTRAMPHLFFEFGTHPSDKWCSTPQQAGQLNWQFYHIIESN